jgi:DNA phosphorothioation-dependent restriction protein DptH
MINAMYNSSYWVTFINPKVDLEFFQKNYENLLIIHYNDQYSSSNYYDAITVTNKSQQFISIVKEYLNGFVPADEKEIYSAIKAFNSINGEWLLKMVGSKGQFSREKLSIVSAIKYALSYLDHKNIIWIPISLEEILRVSGAVKLEKSAGIFSAKNLKVKGNACDDLLLIGLEVDENQSVYLHYYPVEVKVGINQGSVIAKAKEQINKTRSIIDEKLLEINEEKTFLNKFFRNFFVQILLLNSKKFSVNEVWPEKSFDIIETITDKLLNDQYEISKELEPFIGTGAVISFKKDNFWRGVLIEEDILVINLTEEDAYKGVIENLEDIKNRIQLGKTDFNVDKLLSAKYKTKGIYGDRTLIETQTNGQFIGDRTCDGTCDGTCDKEIDAKEIDIEETDIEETEDQIAADNGDKNKHKDLKDIRVLLGTVEGSNKKVYWEFGHEKLSNRHLLISGKSGQGKSYFIQCLLMELAQEGISSIIIDYTDGFKTSQLEPKFKEVMGDRIQQFLVIKDKFPLNPFKMNQKEIDEGEYMDEDYSDVAERVKCIIGAIYKGLGAQQLNAIYQATKRGLERYDGNMNLRILQQELEEDNSSYAKTVSAQLALLFDKDPFDYNNAFDWSNIDKEEGKVFIIQLTGFKREIQLIITEFILWDLWYYKLKDGNKDKPLPVILDEAQNLDHSEKSPSAKILTEGRKFGWSGWYATQFLRGQLDNDEIKRLENSSQMVYFLPPDSEISPVASNLSKDSSEKKDWERKLSSLKKGQCISQGLFIDDSGENKGDVAVVVDITAIGDRMQ